MATVTQDKLLTVHSAAEMLDVSPDTIRRWHKKGLIKAQLGDRGERLFSSAEIKRVTSKSASSEKPWKTLTASKSRLTSIELFCGAGGLALGMHNAGIRSELLIDNDLDCINTLNKNRPDWNAQQASVLDLSLIHI